MAKPKIQPPTKLKPSIQLEWN